MAFMRYGIGEIESSELLTEAVAYPVDEGAEPHPLTIAHLCQAHFYVAGKYSPGTSEWKSHLLTSASYARFRVLHLPEYFLAKYEMSRLDTLRII